MEGAPVMDHDDAGPRVLISIWLLTGMATVFLAVRIWCKFLTRRLLWWDDYILILSWAALVASVVIVHISVLQGLGKHIYDVPVENLAYLGILGNITGTFSILAAVWSKTSFALTLLKLMHGDMKALLWFFIITANIAMYLNALFLWFRCTPVAKTWNPYLEGTCWSPEVYPIFGMCAAGYSALLDFILALLPWKILWGLQMKAREKFGVGIAMSMGIFAGATAVIKTTTIPTLAAGDFTYDSSGLCIWGAAESAVTIMAASIPTLRILFRDNFRNLSKRYYSSNKGSPAGTSGSRLDSSRRKTTVVISRGDVSFNGDNSCDSEREIVRESLSHIQILQTTELAMEIRNVDSDMESQVERQPAHEV